MSKKVPSVTEIDSATTLVGNLNIDSNASTINNFFKWKFFDVGKAPNAFRACFIWVIDRGRRLGSWPGSFLPSSVYSQASYLIFVFQKKADS